LTQGWNVSSSGVELMRLSVVLLFPAILCSASETFGQAVPADSAAVHFVQGMMRHHAQAIVMGEMVRSHTIRADLTTASRRIVVSQTDEIALMRRWLEHRHLSVPAIDTAAPDTLSHSMNGMQAGAMHMTMDPGQMPGMLTHDQLVELARSHGTGFDDKFLRFMIGHHEGALKMVADLFAVPGATDDPELFQLASDIDADQRAEIARMQGMASKSVRASKQRH
jgi:uncharacterized protein (DUF305 family)